MLSFGFLSRRGSRPILFTLFYIFGGALLHHNLVTALALPRMLNNGRREREEMAKRGIKRVTRTSATAEIQGMHRKLRQMPTKSCKNSRSP